MLELLRAGKLPFSFGSPLFLDAPTRDALAAKLEAYPWPREW